MTTSIVTTKKPQSKTELCFKIFKQVVTKEQLTNKEVMRDLRKTLKIRFMTEAGLTEKGVNPYIQICIDRMSGKDPHAGRKIANKTRSAKQKSQQLTSRVLSFLGFNPNLALPLL